MVVGDRKRLLNNVLGQRRSYPIHEMQIRRRRRPRRGRDLLFTTGNCENGRRVTTVERRRIECEPITILSEALEASPVFIFMRNACNYFHSEGADIKKVFLYETGPYQPQMFRHMNEPC